MEFLLLNHPLDCPVCDQAGECHLQDFSFEHGVSATRTVEDRNTFDPVDLGPYIKLNMNRCILCYRCVYAADTASRVVFGSLSQKMRIATVTNALEM